MVFCRSIYRVGWFEMHAVTPFWLWWFASVLRSRDQRLSTWTSNISAVTGISHYLVPDKGHNKITEEVPLDLLRFNVSQYFYDCFCGPVLVNNWRLRPIIWFFVNIFIELIFPFDAYSAWFCPNFLNKLCPSWFIHVSLILHTEARKVI